MKKYLQLNDITCYKRALALSNYVWDIVFEWEWFAKKTIGVQVVTAIDSISANIAEGFGRTHSPRTSAPPDRNPSIDTIYE